MLILIWWCNLQIFENFSIRDTSTLAFLQESFPNGQFPNHWVNFRVSRDHGSNVFNALQNHGWQWEDGTQFGSINNWDPSTFCHALPCCLSIYTFDGKFNFDNCQDVKVALCEYKPIANGKHRFSTQKPVLAGFFVEKSSFGLLLGSFVLFTYF